MYADRITVIGVAGRDDLDVFQQWVVQHGVDGFDHIADLELDIWREYGIRAQPAFAFINDDGTVVEARQGRLGIEGLTERIESLLAT